MEGAEEAIQATTMLAKTVELKDGYTEEHCERLAAIALAIGKRIALTEESLKQLRYGALLHDVGKLGIADNILGKPGRLTPSEWVEIRRHPTIGKEIVEKINGLGLVARIMEEHHERVDGKSYPKGLKGDEILLEARIVADAYDAMRSDRPYRRALSKEEAIKDLKKNAGSQFDPLVVKVFLEILDEGSAAPTQTGSRRIPARRSRFRRIHQDAAILFCNLILSSARRSVLIVPVWLHAGMSKTFRIVE